MVGITSSSEQIRNAPAEVRRWIEREVLTSLGQHTAPDNGSKAHSEHLAACSEEEITAILAQIEGVLPAVNVFFEFGRQGAVFGQPSVEAFRLPDIAHHVRLQNIGQVIACLDIINQAFGRVCGDPDAKFCGLGRDGHCFIMLETQQNILKVWRKLIANQRLLELNQEGLTTASEPADAIALNHAVDAASPNRPAMNGDEATARLFE